MKFKFTLQAVLDARHSWVEALEIQLSQLFRDRQNLLDQLQNLKDKLEELFDALEDTMKAEEMDLFLMKRLHLNISFVDQQIDQTEKNIKKIEERINNKRKELVLAKQEEEVMEILKEKEYQRLLDQIAIADARLLDDIYVSRAFRMSQEELT